MVIWVQHRGVTLLLTSVISIFFDFTLMFEISLLFLYQILFLHFCIIEKILYNIWTFYFKSHIRLFLQRYNISWDRFSTEQTLFCIDILSWFPFYAVIIPSGCNICSVDKLLYSPVRLHHVLITHYISIEPGSRHNYYSSVPCSFLSNQRWLSEFKFN